MSLISGPYPPTLNRQPYASHGASGTSPSPSAPSRLSHDYYSSPASSSSYNGSSPYGGASGGGSGTSAPAGGNSLRSSSSSVFNPHSSPSAGSLPVVPALNSVDSPNYFSTGGWIYRPLSPTSSADLIYTTGGLISRQRAIQHHHQTGSAASSAGGLQGLCAAAGDVVYLGHGADAASFADYSGLSAMLSAAAADGALASSASGGPPVRVRVVKRRFSANRKERRRTHSINSAFSALRGCIPNVPSDTKLSKIKTLRLATSYIAYLMDVLNKDDPALAQVGAFKAEIAKKTETREEKKRRESEEILKASGAAAEKPSKGRTGWPQQVWAAELKQ